MRALHRGLLVRVVIGMAVATCASSCSSGTSASDLSALSAALSDAGSVAPPEGAVVLGPDAVNKCRYDNLDGNKEPVASRDYKVPKGTAVVQWYGERLPAAGWTLEGDGYSKRVGDDRIVINLLAWEGSYELTASFGDRKFCT